MRPLALLVGFACLAVACSTASTKTESFICDPVCPPGTTCSPEGCIVDLSNRPDLAMDVDLLATCSPPCSGTNAFCNPATSQCVPCLEDGHCPTGSVCRAVGLSFACLPGCKDDGRCGGGTMLCCGGACIDTASDARNCGGCDVVCTADHAAAECNGGACVSSSCLPGWGDCDLDPADGCETNLRTSPDNCTACGTKCAFRNGIGGCSNGCYLTACSYGWDDCDSDPSNGCEKSLISDKANCGACGKVCGGVAHGQVACLNASCQLAACDQGFDDCDRLAGNGCETALFIDKANCGKCGNVCGQGNVCVNGGCTCAMCNIPGAKTKCLNLQCVFDECALGFADCNNDLKDGCEVDLNADRNNCSACGSPCPKNQVCAAGKCVTGNCPPKAFFTGQLPASLPGTNGNAFGSMAFDGSGNLLMVSGFSPNNLYSIDLTTDQVTNLIALPQGKTWVSLAYNPADNSAYIGADSSDIVAYSFQNKMVNAVTNLGVSSLNSLIIAPQAFGNWGGQLIGGGQSGTVAAWDLKNNMKTTVAAALGNIAALTASQAGVVYALDYDNRRLWQIASNGMATQLLGLNSSSDGLAFDEVRQRIYIADSSAGRIHYVELNNGNKLSDFQGNYTFDGGYWPSPMAFDCGSTLLYALNPGGPTKVQAVQVP